MNQARFINILERLFSNFKEYIENDEEYKKELSQNNTVFGYYSMLECNRLRLIHVEKIIKFINKSILDGVINWDFVFISIFLTLKVYNDIIIFILIDDFSFKLINNISYENQIKLINFFVDNNLSLFNIGNINIFNRVKNKFNLDISFDLISKKLYNKITIEELETCLENSSCELSTKIMKEVFFNAIESTLWFDKFINFWIKYCDINETPEFLKKIKYWVKKLNSKRTVESYDDCGYYIDDAKYKELNFDYIFNEYINIYPSLKTFVSKYDYDSDKMIDWYYINDKEYYKFEEIINSFLSKLAGRYFLNIKFNELNFDCVNIFSKIMNFI